eukprot:70242-Chlamydomonas_euryale.AAC.1
MAHGWPFLVCACATPRVCVSQHRVCAWRMGGSSMWHGLSGAISLLPHWMRLLLFAWTATPFIPWHMSGACATGQSSATRRA